MQLENILGGCYIHPGVQWRWINQQAHPSSELFKSGWKVKDQHRELLRLRTNRISRVRQCGVLALSHTDSFEVGTGNRGKVFFPIYSIFISSLWKFHTGLKLETKELLTSKLGISLFSSVFCLMKTLGLVPSQEHFCNHDYCGESLMTPSQSDGVGSWSHSQLYKR